jgi:hypothetical protein
MGKFFLNLSANVGRGQANNPEDVQIVQFGYYCITRDHNALMTPQGRAIFSAVQPGAPFRDVPEDPLSQAIVAHQQYKGGTQDGYISVIPNAQMQYGTGDAKNYRMWAYLLGSIHHVNKDTFPRLDRHPNCPPLVRAAMHRIFYLAA